MVEDDVPLPHPRTLVADVDLAAVAIAVPVFAAWTVAWTTLQVVDAVRYLRGR